MSYRKTIVCLAKSIKHGGYCIAGKEVESGKWIRPVSDREDEEIRLEDCTCENNKQPRLLDIISAPLLEPRDQPGVFVPPTMLALSSQAG